MSSDNSIKAMTNSIPLAVGDLARFAPEPKSNLGALFSSTLNTVASLFGKSAVASTAIDPAYADLINMQVEVQRQMQLVTMYSNIEKAKHETEMAAIRNIRAS